METPGHAALAGAEASSLGGTTPTAVTGSTPFKSFKFDHIKILLCYLF